FAVLGDRIGQGVHGVVYALAYVIDHPARWEVPEELRVLKVRTAADHLWTALNSLDRSVGDLESEVLFTLRAASMVPPLGHTDPRLVRWVDGQGAKHEGLSMDLVDAPFCWDVYASDPDQPLPAVVGWAHVETLRLIRSRLGEAGVSVTDFQGFYLPGGQFLLTDPTDVGSGLDPDDAAFLDALIGNFIDDLEARLTRRGDPRPGEAAEAVDAGLTNDQRNDPGLPGNEESLGVPIGGSVADDGPVWPSPVGPLRDTGERRGRTSALIVFEQVDDGRRWLFRRLDAVGRPMGTDGAWREVAASRVVRRLGLHAPEVHVALLGDGTHPAEPGSLQEMVEGADAWPDGFDPSTASARDVDRVLREQVVDWFLGNVDGHRDNFLRLPDGSLVGIDKQMAFGRFDDDLAWVLRTPTPQLRPDADYQRVYGAIWVPAARGERPIPDPASGPLGEMIRRVMAIDDDELRELVRPRVANLAEGGPARQETRIDELPAAAVDAMIGRKHRLAEDFARLHAEALARRTGRRPELPGSGPSFGVPFDHEPGHEHSQDDREHGGRRGSEHDNQEAFSTSPAGLDGLEELGAARPRPRHDADARLAVDLTTGFAVLGDRIGDGTHGTVHAVAYLLDHEARREVVAERRVVKVPRPTPPSYLSPRGRDEWSPHEVGDVAHEVHYLQHALAALPGVRGAGPRLVQWQDAEGADRFGVSMDLVDAPFCWQLFELAPDADLPELVCAAHLRQLRVIEEELRRAGLGSCRLQGFYLPGGEVLLADLSDAKVVGDWEPD
ncbi:MAG: hypothetical protein ACRCY9_21300, partial [Phycicoccus sp.]